MKNGPPDTSDRLPALDMENTSMAAYEPLYDPLSVTKTKFPAQLTATLNGVALEAVSYTHLDVYKRQE